MECSLQWEAAFYRWKPSKENNLQLTAIMEDNIWWNIILCWRTTSDGRLLLKKDNLKWKTRWPLVENNLQLKTGRRPSREDTFDGRRPFNEEDLHWRKILYGGKLLMEEDIRWKKTFHGRWHLMEDDIWWKTTFNRRGPLMEGRQPQKFKWTSTMRTTSKIKRTCTLLEGKRRWTYSALWGFFC